MTVHYELLIKGLKYGPSDTYCCYGNIEQVIDDQYDFSNEDFRGLRIHLGITEQYHKMTTHKARFRAEREWSLSGFKDIADHFGVYVHTDEAGQVDRITFPARCPMFFVVIATGWWRMYANHPEMWNIMRSIRNVVDTNISWHTIYAIAVNLGLSEWETNRMWQRGRETTITMRTHNTHMPWGGRCIVPNHLRHTRAVTLKDWDNLPSMKDELIEEGCLSYDGRDDFMMGEKEVEHHNIFQVQGLQRYISQPAQYGAAVISPTGLKKLIYALDEYSQPGCTDTDLKYHGDSNRPYPKERSAITSWYGAKFNVEPKWSPVTYMEPVQYSQRMSHTDNEIPSDMRAIPKHVLYNKAGDPDIW